VICVCVHVEICGGRRDSPVDLSEQPLLHSQLNIHCPSEFASRKNVCTLACPAKNIFVCQFTHMYKAYIYMLTCVYVYIHM
jgi:hypothetical protein